MFKQKIFIISTVVLIILAVMHFLGIKYEIYFLFEKYDIPMHILGGLWIALTAFWLLPYLMKDCSIKNYRVRSLCFGLLSVIVLASIWEGFELFSGITSVKDAVFWDDTIGDYVCAIIGLAIGFTFFINQRKCANGICEVVKPINLNNLNIR